MFLMKITRLDIASIAGKLTRFNSNPGNEHWIVTISVLRYLYGKKKKKGLAGNI